MKHIEVETIDDEAELPEQLKRLQFVCPNCGRIDFISHYNPLNIPGVSGPGYICDKKCKP